MLVLAPALQGFCVSDPLTDNLLATAAELGVPIYVHTGPHSSSAPTQLVLVAAKHPAAKFILGHCGSTDYAHDMPAVLQCGLTNVWFELSLVRPWVVADYCELGGFSRLIFASSAPRNDPNLELQYFRRYLSIDTHAAIFGENLRRLLEEIN
jgi:predicted TIM-barrel fold metal-dependent hydrolase